VDTLLSRKIISKSMRTFLVTNENYISQQKSFSATSHDSGRCVSFSFSIFV
jgi:hypothetical protein